MVNGPIQQTQSGTAMSLTICSQHHEVSLSPRPNVTVPIQRHTARETIESRDARGVEAGFFCRGQLLRRHTSALANAFCFDYCLPVRMSVQTEDLSSSFSFQAEAPLAMTRVAVGWGFSTAQWIFPSPLRQLAKFLL